MKTESSGIYVIHRLQDTEIAKVIIGNLHRWTEREIPIFKSSSINEESRKIWRNPPLEIRSALLNSGLLLLIFTEIDDDWLYCMWEYSLAAKFLQNDKRIIIFQLGPDLPPILETHQRVLLDKESMVNFAFNIHRNSALYCKSNMPWSPILNDEEIYLRGTILFEFLEEITSLEMKTR